MQGTFFMQLLLLAALFLLGSGGSDRPELSNSELTEILKCVSDGNGELENIVKQVEQISGIISAFAPLMAAGRQSDGNEVGSGGTPSVGYCLKPIANIADDSIYNALSKAIA